MKAPLVIIFAFVAFSSTSVAQEISQPQQVFKISLSDFALGQYSLEYERVAGEDWSAGVSISGIDFETSAESYYLGHFYDAMGEWHSVYSKIDASVSGFEACLNLRKYGVIKGDMPEGFYAGVFLQLRHVKSDLAEEFSAPEAYSIWYGQAYPHSIDHQAEFNSLGIGVQLGYQWMADNGLSLDVFAGPMFRRANRTLAFDELPVSEEAALDAVDDRMHQYYHISSLSRFYQARTGSWFKAGLSLGLAF